MLAWMRCFGEVERVGVESTGSYGAGLLRFLQQAGVTVLEVTTPDRQDRRRRGKNDDFDAQNAAHAAFAGIRTVTPKSRDGMIEALRVLSACRKTAVTARRRPADDPEHYRVRAGELARDAAPHDPHAARANAGSLATGPNSLSGRGGRLPDQPEVPARRYLELHDEIADLDAMIAAIVDELAPNLVARNSIGHRGAAQLLLTAGDNPQRLRSEAGFAALCGVSPVPASTGKTARHRLTGAATEPPAARCISSLSAG